MIVVISVYMVANLACIGFFARFRREEFSWLRHGLVPLLGIAAFVPALLTAAGVPAFSFVSKLAAPASYAGTAVGVWLLVGLAILAWLWKNHRDRVVQIGTLFESGDDDGAVEAGEPAESAEPAAASEADSIETESPENESPETEAPESETPEADTPEADTPGDDAGTGTSTSTSTTKEDGPTE